MKELVNSDSFLLEISHIDNIYLIFSNNDEVLYLTKISNTHYQVRIDKFVMFDFLNITIQQLHFTKPPSPKNLQKHICKVVEGVDYNNLKLINIGG
jgi:tRNA(His) 5'-end guanylyltransferase